MAASYELSIRRQDSPEAAEGRSQGHRVVLTATVVRGFKDAGVFVSMRKTSADFFTNVASPSDINDLDLNNVDEDGRLRHDVLDLVFSAKSLADEVIDEIMVELTVLCEEMARLNGSINETSVTSVLSDD